MTNMRPGRGAEQIIVRLPDGLKDRLREAAEANGRSLNAEAVARLTDSLDTPQIADIHITLDTNGQPISWEEIHQNLQLINNSLGKSPVSLQVKVNTTNLISSKDPIETKRTPSLFSENLQDILRKVQSGEFVLEKMSEAERKDILSRIAGRAKKASA